MSKNHFASLHRFAFEKRRSGASVARHWPGMLVLLIVFQTSISVSAQESSSPVPETENAAAQILNDNTLPEPAPDDDDRLVRELGQLQVEWAQDKESTESGTSRGSSLLQQINSTETASAMEINELKQRVRTLLEQEQRRAAAQTAMTQLHQPENSIAPDADGEVNDSALRDQVLPEPSQDDESETEAVSPQMHNVSSRKILSEPADKLQLANNLYASGEMELAMELFRQVRMKTHTRDEQVWLEFQIASCLRRLGKPDEARNLLREIASQSETGVVAESARWWLDAMDRRQEIEATRNLLQQYISAKQENP